MILYFMNYNNYGNRIIKKFNTIEGYQPYFLKDQPINNVLFDYGDGVNTQVVLNMNQLDKIPNYVVGVNENDEIDSRWFIIETKYTRNRQYICTLRRDLIADNLETVLTSPSFIEKGWINNLTDPAIYNREQLEVNQIKTKQIQLNQGIPNLPWVVAYFQLPKDDQGNLQDKTIEIKDALKADIRVSDIEKWEFYKYANKISPYEINEILYRWITRIGPGGGISSNAYTADLYGISLKYELNGPVSERTTLYTTNDYSVKKLKDSTKVADLNNVAKQFFSVMDLSTVNKLQELNGKTIFDNKTQKTYQIITQFVDAEQSQSQYVNSGNLKDKMMEHWNYAGGGGTASNNNLYVEAHFKIISFQLMEINAKITTLTLSKNIIKNTEAPYYIMTFPYYDGDILIRDGSSTNITVKSTKDLALNLATSISKELGSLSFDIQIVPYFYYNDRLDISIDQKPIIDITNLNIALDGGDSGPYYPLKTQVAYYPLTEQKKNSILFFLDKSSFSFSQIKNNIEGAKHYTDVYTKKQDVQTLKYRFCSPSFNSIFEFNPALNDGYNGFSVYATLKPYSPYFRVVPQFNGLYGKNFNGEQRGLVMTGDFSITQLTDAYTNYVNSNKNFQNIFDRSIENLEFTNEQELERQRWNMRTAWMSGISSGLQTGALLGKGLRRHIDRYSRRSGHRCCIRSWCDYGL